MFESIKRILRRTPPPQKKAEVGLQPDASVPKQPAGPFLFDVYNLFVGAWLHGGGFDPTFCFDEDSFDEEMRRRFPTELELESSLNRAMHTFGWCIDWPQTTYSSAEREKIKAAVRAYIETSSRLNGCNLGTFYSTLKAVLITTGFDAVAPDELVKVLEEPCDLPWRLRGFFVNNERICFEVFLTMEQQKKLYYGESNGAKRQADVRSTKQFEDSFAGTIPPSGPERFQQARDSMKIDTSEQEIPWLDEDGEMRMYVPPLDFSNTPEHLKSKNFTDMTDEELDLMSDLNGGGQYWIDFIKNEGRKRVR